MSLTDEDKQWIQDLLQDTLQDALRVQSDNLVTLIISVKDSLGKEIGAVGRGLKADIAALTTRFDNFSTRLDRQAGLLQAGTRRVAGLDDWAEKIDRALELKDREIAELRDRIQRLEQE